MGRWGDGEKRIRFPNTQYPIPHTQYPIPHTQYPIPNPVPIQEQKITIDSLEWFYREATPPGESDLLPVILLHGIVSQSYSWRNIIPILAQQGTRAIAPDWIGYGYSAKPEKRDFAYTPNAFIQALE
jgi:alpha-beta hydrolase superfamily lysophospholipase